MTQNWAEICWLVLVVYGICVYICSGFNFFWERCHTFESLCIFPITFTLNMLRLSPKMIEHLFFRSPTLLQSSSLKYHHIDRLPEHIVTIKPSPIYFQHWQLIQICQNTTLKDEIDSATNWQSIWQSIAPQSSRWSLQHLVRLTSSPLHLKFILNFKNSFKCVYFSSCHDYK